MRSLHESFRAEVEQAVVWYEAEQPGIGERFAEAVDSALAQIEQRPRSFPVIVKRRRIRQALVARFPYAIYFRATRGVEYVLAIAHLARSPRAIRRNLQTRDRDT